MNKVITQLAQAFFGIEREYAGVTSLSLQRDWLIYVLDAISASVEPGSEIAGIVEEAQGAIPEKVYEAAVERFLVE